MDDESVDLRRPAVKGRRYDASRRRECVSMELICKAFGGKAGLVREIVNRALRGQGPVPAPVRSDAVAATDIDARYLLGEWSRLATEVSPRGTPIVMLVRTGAVRPPGHPARLDPRPVRGLPVPRDERAAAGELIRRPAVSR